MIGNWSWFQKEVEKVYCANSTRCSLHQDQGCQIANEGVWLVTEKTDYQGKEKEEKLAKIRKDAPCSLRRVREWAADPQTGRSQLSGVDVYFEPTLPIKL